jgi:hypothetical protein
MNAKRRGGVLLLASGGMLAVAALLVNWSEAQGQIPIPIPIPNVTVPEAECKQTSSNCNECQIIIYRPGNFDFCYARVCAEDIPLIYKVCIPAPGGSCVLTHAIPACSGLCFIQYCDELHHEGNDYFCDGCDCTSTGGETDNAGMTYLCSS